MELKKDGTFPNGMSEEETNSYLVEQLFVGSHERTIPVKTNEDDSKPKYQISYVALTSTDLGEIGIFYEGETIEDKKDREKVLCEAAKSMRSINGKSVANDLFKLNFYQDFRGSIIVMKQVFQGGVAIERNLESKPLTEFEKRYLVLGKMDYNIVFLFHTALTADSMKLIDTLFFDDDKDKKEEKTKSRYKEGKKNDPLVSGEGS